MSTFCYFDGKILMNALPELWQSYASFKLRDLDLERWDSSQTPVRVGLLHVLHWDLIKKWHCPGSTQWRTLLWPFSSYSLWEKKFTGAKWLHLLSSNKPHLHHPKHLGLQNFLPNVSVPMSREGTGFSHWSVLPRADCANTARLHENQIIVSEKGRTELGLMMGSSYASSWGCSWCKTNL